MLLILFDLDRGRHHQWRVEAEQRVHGQDTGLVAQNGPAEMKELMESHEAAHADDDVDKSGNHQQPHPRLYGAQAFVFVQVEAFQSLDRLPHDDVAHVRIQHVKYDDKQGEEDLD